eukprot:6481534-Amphidinium_carterae.3
MSLLTEYGFTSNRACPTLVYHSDSNVRISIHVDEPLGLRPHVNMMDVFRHLQQHLEGRVGGAMGMEKTKYLVGTLFWPEFGVMNSFYEQATEGHIAKMLVQRSYQLYTNATVAKSLASSTRSQSHTSSRSSLSLVARPNRTEEVDSTKSRSYQAIRLICVQNT